MSSEDFSVPKSERRRRQVREAQARFRDRKDREMDELRYQVESLSRQLHQSELMNEILRSRLSKYEPAQNFSGEGSNSGSILRGLTNANDRISPLPSMPSFGPRAEHQSVDPSSVQRSLPQHGDPMSLGLIDRQSVFSDSSSPAFGPGPSPPSQRTDSRGSMTPSSGWPDHTRIPQVDGVKSGWLLKNQVDGIVDQEQPAPHPPDDFAFRHLHPQDQHHQYYQQQPGQFINAIGSRSRSSNYGDQHPEHTKASIDGQLYPHGNQ